MSSCPLCNPRAEQIFLQGKLIIGLWADPAVTPGHAVLVTRRHVTDWFAASPAEQQELIASLAAVRDAILEQQLPDGFNIGIHIGAAAGQNVPHLHVDVIPRYRQAAAASDAARATPAQEPPAQEPPAQEPPAQEPDKPVEPAGARPPGQPRKQTDAWSGQASTGEPVLDRVERELEAKARRQPTPASEGGKVTQFPGTTRSTAELAPAPPSEPDHEQARQHHGLSAVPAPTDALEAEPSVSDEPEETSSAYTRAPSFSRGDDYGQTLDYDDDDDLYDDEGETRLPGRGKTWAVLLVLVLLAVGGGYAAYWAKTSPYIGEPPEHLKITSKQLVPAPAAAAPADVEVGKPELPAAPRERSALAPVRTIPGTTTPAPGAAPGAAAPASSEYDSLMAQASKLLKQRKQRAAYKLLNKALEVQPGGWQALQHLAWRDAKTGRLGRALKRAREALKANKDAPYANLVLGVAMHERGRTATARAGYSKYLAHCKGCPEAGEIRRVLRSLGEED